ncbi:MAG: hypothetical protein GWN87_12305 [Desulfuromonadales bacterium]|nr:hypothetical protein [Desulfuromonadales bacterium]
MTPNSALTEDFRRTFLAALKYSKTGNGDRDFLQDRLNQAGFDVFVYQNSPAIDPACAGIFTGAYLMYAGDTLSQAGEPGAVAGLFRGQITGMEFAEIPNERREQFRRLILKIKPLHSWAVLAVNYV